MVDVVTITPNPAIDLSTSIDKILPVAKLCGTSPGGGGINVARVIKRLGGEAHAIYPAGGVIRSLLRKLLDEEGVASNTSTIASETREDFFVHEISTGEQYRFILPGPQLSELEIAGLFAGHFRDRSISALCGRKRKLPKGVPDFFYARVAKIARQRGAKMMRARLRRCRRRRSDQVKFAGNARADRKRALRCLRVGSRGQSPRPGRAGHRRRVDDGLSRRSTRYPQPRSCVRNHSP